MAGFAGRNRPAAAPQGASAPQVFSWTPQQKGVQLFRFAMPPAPYQHSSHRSGGGSPPGRAARNAPNRLEKTAAVDVLLVDDHKIMRDGIKAILSQAAEFRVVGE